MQFKGGGISGHFFPEDPSAEVFGPVGGRAKAGFILDGYKIALSR